MSNVVEFPIQPKVEVLAEQITTLQEGLLSRFDQLTDHYVASRQLETECNELQERYDTLVMKYAAAVGEENLPLGIMEYCTKVIASFDADTSEISFALEDDEGALAMDDEKALAGERVKTGDKAVDDITEFMDSITNFLRKKMDELH